MASFAQGQPFSSGPIWDQMRFGGEQTTGTMPIAGSYMDQMRNFFTSIPSDIPKDDRLIYGLLGAQSIGADIASRRSEAMFDKALAYQREASERANEMGIRNTVISSFLKDVPAAIGNAFAQRQRYTPEQIEIASRAMELQPRGGSIPNYYSFVR